MPEPLGRDFTHGTYDRKACERLLADDSAREATCTCLELLGACLVVNPEDDGCQTRWQALGDALDAGWPLGRSDTVELAAKMIRKSIGAPGAGVPGVSEDVARAAIRNAMSEDYQWLFRSPDLAAAPWGSVYMGRDQVRYGWTWECLRDWMSANGIRGTYAKKDPEDNFGRLLCLAAELAKAKRADLFGELLADHVLCWSSRFLDAVESSAQTGAYRGLALLCSTTLRDLKELAGIVPAERQTYR